MEDNMDVVTYFQSMFNFPIDPNMVKVALKRRGVSCVNERREEELVLADILIMLARASQTYTNQTGSDHFNMTVRGEIIPLADRAAMRAEAVAIYRKYEEPYNVPLTNAINI